MGQQDKSKGTRAQRKETADHMQCGAQTPHGECCCEQLLSWHFPGDLPHQKEPWPEDSSLCNLGSWGPSEVPTGLLSSVIRRFAHPAVWPPQSLEFQLAEESWDVRPILTLPCAGATEPGFYCLGPQQ